MDDNNLILVHDNRSLQSAVQALQKRHGYTINLIATKKEAVSYILFHV